MKTYNQFQFGIDSFVLFAKVRKLEVHPIVGDKIERISSLCSILIHHWIAFSQRLTEANYKKSQDDELAHHYDCYNIQSDVEPFLK